MNHQYLSFDKINNLSDWWLENSKSRNVEIAALEPLIWKSGDNNIIDVVRIFKEKGFSVSMTSNGAYLKKYAKLLKDAELDLLRVSWHSMDEEIYKKVTGGGKLHKLLDGLAEASLCNLNISINRVLMKGYTDDLSQQIEYIDKYKLRLKLLDLYWTADSAIDYLHYYISPQDVLKKYIFNREISLLEDPNFKHGRERIRYSTVNGGLIEYKLQSTVNRPPICESCFQKENCLEGFGDYLRIFPNGEASLCYLRNDLGTNFFELDKIAIEPDFMNSILSEHIDTIPLRIVLEGRCNFNCGFPNSTNSWCLKQGRGFIFPTRKLVLKNVS